LYIQVGKHSRDEARRKGIVENGSVSERLFWRYTPRVEIMAQTLPFSTIKISPDS
jgi:hypothetical protein